MLLSQPHAGRAYEDTWLLLQSTYDGPPKLVVFGGNGFVGTRVCEEALNTGLAVVSISRSATPKVSAHWTSQVDWVSVSLCFTQSFRSQTVCGMQLNLFIFTSLLQTHVADQEGSGQAVAACSSLYCLMLLAVLLCWSRSTTFVRCTNRACELPVSTVQWPVACRVLLHS